jgi:2-polyprenyl-3-methyl-5-hydroxy-6-metoxy-1,4-benzoquinol methylase
VNIEPMCIHTCNLCGSMDNILIFPEGASPPLHGLKRGIVKCASCGLVFRNIRPTDKDLQNFYTEGRIKNETDDWVAGRINVFRPYASLFEHYRKTNRILDIGAGHGFFLSMMQQKGWKCEGIEPSRSCAEFARKNFKISMENNFSHGAHYEDNRFDAVTFWNVLDHLPNPLETLKEVNRILRPGGLLLVRSPNATFHVPVKRVLKRTKGMLRLFGFTDQSIFHLYSFDRNTIAGILKASGFIHCKVMPARLSWTTSPESKDSQLKKLMTHYIDLFCRMTYSISSDRILISPSFLALSNKTE